MTPSKISGRRKYALTVFVYAGAILFALVLLVGPSTDRGARLAMAGLGILVIIFGVFRPSGFLEDDSPSSRRSAFDWFIVLVYICAGIAAIIGAFTASFG